ncbi:MAG: methyltransferase domain-containing protein [Trichocoleus desertorum ATA4-8-CV12]|jgi:SAM-dependent methyltransferase|nr:methyltransferase domain-containing protein [Trichocoleus desertorum ATA4-8-CV12]
MLYEAVNYPVLKKIPKTTKHLLDLGCGSGSLGKQIKQVFDCRVVGVTYSNTEAEVASTHLDQVIVDDLNNLSLENLKQFDCIVCSHILEHLHSPHLLLSQLHGNLTVDGVLIVALPNVLYWKQRWEFLTGRFRYTDGGLMDKTHFRFFDWQTGQELLEQNGYKVIEAEADGNFPLPVIRRFLPHSISSLLDRTTVRMFPGLFGFQFIFCCRLK